MITFADITQLGLVETIQSGGIGVVKTDTLYGLVGSALNASAVAKIYATKRRNSSKPLIVLVSDVTQLFDPIPAATNGVIANYWPGPNTIIFASPHAPNWLRSKEGEVAYRIPASQSLRNLLRLTGPLVAPSANREGEQPLESAEQASEYFGDEIDFIVEDMPIYDGQPSRLYRVSATGALERMR